MELNYNKITEKHIPDIKNFYIYEKNNTVEGFMLISSIKDKIFLLKFKETELDSQEAKSYLSGDLQDPKNEDSSWYWTKYLLQFMDGILDRETKIISIDSMEDTLEYKEPDINYVFEITKENFKDTGYLLNFVDEDLLEVVTKLLHQDKEKPYLDEEIKSDLVDTQVWLLDTLYDNN